MFEDNEEQFDDQFQLELTRFENMIDVGDAYYFDPEVLELIIDHYIIKNQLKKANVAVNFASNQHPSHSNFDLKKAQIYSTTGQLKESLLLLQALEKIDPYNAEVFITIANVFSQLRDHSKSIKYYEKALSIDQNSNDNAQEITEIMLDLALEYENLLDFNGAIKVLDKLLSHSPDNESAIYEIAYCYERLGNFDKCIEYYNKYIDNNPYSFTAWYNLGNIYFLKKDTEKALWAYGFSTIINEDFSSAHFNIGNTYMQIEDFDNAIAAYEKCLKLDSDDALTLCYMGEAYERKEQYETALKYYNKSKTINVDLADAWLGIGIVKDLLGQTNQSISYLQQAVNIQTSNANYNLVLGEALFKLERFAEAELALERALQLDGTYSEAIELLTKIKFEYNIVEAIDFLVQSDESNSLSLSNKMLLVSLFWYNGQKIESLELFKNEYLQNAKKSIKYLLLHFPESKKISDFNNIINPNNE